LRSYSWSPEADSGAEVDVDFLVGGANVRENHWACLILVVCLRALLQGVKAALLQCLSQVSESYPSTFSRQCYSLGSFGVRFHILVRVVGGILRFPSSSEW
jgi:hypothetical protein